jgi:hypothetical protein
VLRSPRAHRNTVVCILGHPVIDVNPYFQVAPKIVSEYAWSVPTETKKRGRGRPGKPEGERFVRVPLKLPPSLLSRLNAIVPEGQRNATICALVREWLDEQE